MRACGGAPRGFQRVGRIDVRASSSARPANDDRLAARPLQTGAAATVSNAGASQEIGERLTCGTASYAATMWFSWTAPSIGDLVITSSAAFGDTVVTVYRGGSVVGCNAGPTARVPVRTTAGEYLVQVGSKGSDVDGLGVGPVTVKAAFAPDSDVDHDGDPASTDCNDHNPAIRHGIVDVPDDGIDQNCDGVDATNPDRDGDGETRPADCDDNDAAIHHGAVDIPGDGIDQDCSGADAPALVREIDRPVPVIVAGPAVERPAPTAAPRVLSGVDDKWIVTKRYTKVARLVVEDVPAGAAVTVNRAPVRVTGGRASLTKRFKGRRLKPGRVIQIRVTAPGMTQRTIRFTIRARKLPLKAIL